MKRLDAFKNYGSFKFDLKTFLMLQKSRLLIALLRIGLITSARAQTECHTTFKLICESRLTAPETSKSSPIQVLFGSSFAKF